MDHAMVFSTGYQANLGIISTIAGKGDYIVLDIDSHASIGTAARSAMPKWCRSSTTTSKRWTSGSAASPKAPASWSCSKASIPCSAISPRSRKWSRWQGHGAMVLVDEAHSMGFIGEHGRGVAEAQGVLDQVDFVIGTFSKSVGTVGGFCVSNHPKFEILRLVCRPYVFTASLPPSVVATAATSIRKLMHGSNKRAHLWENSKRLHGGLRRSASRSAPTSRRARSSR
jgi:7-keto-8-aminopelargonate synthetase-like enzyme